MAAEDTAAEAALVVDREAAEASGADLVAASEEDPVVALAEDREVVLAVDREDRTDRAASADPAWVGADRPCTITTAGGADHPDARTTAAVFRSAAACQSSVPCSSQHWQSFC